MECLSSYQLLNTLFFLFFLIASCISACDMDFTASHHYRWVNANLHGIISALNFFLPFLGVFHMHECSKNAMKQRQNSWLTNNKTKSSHQLQQLHTHTDTQHRWRTKPESIFKFDTYIKLFANILRSTKGTQLWQNGMRQKGESERWREEQCSL